MDSDEIINKKQNQMKKQTKQNQITNKPLKYLY